MAGKWLVGSGDVLWLSRGMPELSVSTFPELKMGVSFPLLAALSFQGMPLWEPGSYELVSWLGGL